MAAASSSPNSPAPRDLGFSRFVHADLFLQAITQGSLFAYRKGLSIRKSPTFAVTHVFAVSTPHCASRAAATIKESYQDNRYRSYSARVSQ